MIRKHEECGLFIDLPYRAGQPQVGDIVISKGVRGIGTAYLILTSRKVQRRKSAILARFSLRCARVPVEETFSLRTWEFHWYKRDSTRQKLIRRLPFES